jgi:hypothetical protein
MAVQSTIYMVNSLLIKIYIGSLHTSYKPVYECLLNSLVSLFYSFQVEPMTPTVSDALREADQLLLSKTPRVPLV